MAEPFLFLHEAALTAEGARGIYRITGREDALRGHFKHAPIMPASLMMEALGQLGVFFLLHHPTAAEAAGAPVSPVSIFFTACDGVRCSKVCRPGDLLELEVKARRLRAPLGMISGEIKAGNERVMRVEEIALTFSA